MDAITNNLPLEASSFVGREDDIIEVQRLLVTTRLLTLTGSGGTGKTRLSLQVAAALLDAYKDGVWFVELAPLSDPALVPVAIAAVLGVQQEQGRALQATLLDWLHAKQLVLILDNCEHVIDACATFADAVLRSCRDMRILATSREALGIGGETSYRVPSLAGPTLREAASSSLAQLTQFPAVQLFSARAMQSLTSFRLTEANAHAVAQICYRLDGIPLAIELAAARIKVLSPEQIAARLDDSFRLLIGGSRTALPRQQTLRGAIDWSHSLLSEAERLLLRRLAVFAGGWTLEAAEEVTKDEGGRMEDEPIPPSSPFVPLQTGFILHPSDVLDLLTHLVDKSLVLADGQGGATRYRMLETVRQYAREKLLDAHESEALRDRHLSFYFDLAERAEPALYSAQRTVWIPRLEADLDNLRAALEWACERDIEIARQLAGNLRVFWHYTDRLGEGSAWYERLLGSSGHSEKTKGNALVLLAASIGFKGQIVDEEAKTWLTQSAAIFRVLGEREKLAESVVWLASATGILGDAEGACAMFEAHEDLIRQCARPEMVVRALVNYARSVASVRNHKQKAIALFEESLSLAREQSDPNALGMAYSIYGLWSLQVEDYDAAWRFQTESMRWLRLGISLTPLSLAIGYAADVATLRHDNQPAHELYAEVLGYCKAFGYQLYICRLLSRLGYLAVQEGALAQAEAQLGECMSLCRERNALLGIAECLAGYAELHRAQGQTSQAVRVLAAPALLPLRSITGNPFNHIAYQRSVNSARAELAPSDFAAAWAEGQAMTLADAIAEAQREPQEPQPSPSSASPSDNAAGLSARELAVLKLLAAGLTNHEIAEKLVLSPYTVQAHLRNIYGKLGVANRSAATRYAADHHLV